MTASKQCSLCQMILLFKDARDVQRVGEGKEYVVLEESETCLNALCFLC